MQTTLLTETFLSPAYAAGTRNLITSNTTITFMQTVAMAASVLREQMALGKTGALLITDAKAALTGCAWSAASETVLVAAIHHHGDMGKRHRCGSGDVYYCERHRFDDVHCEPLQNSRIISYRL